MKKEEKAVMVSELREKFSRAKVAVLAEFSGMKVEEIREVKNLLRGAKGEFKVIKNTMAVRAAEGTALQGLAKHFKGPIAVALGYEDPIAPTKALKTLSEKQKKLKIRMGVFETQLVDPAGLNQIAQLPPRPVLMSQLLSRLQSPLYGLAGSLNGVLGKFVRTLQALHEKRQESQG